VVKAIVLIDCRVGKPTAVSSALRELMGHPKGNSSARVLAADSVTGPFDVIAAIESDTLDKIGQFVTDVIQNVDGVLRTETCLCLAA